MDKDPSELWGILNWLYPNEFTSYWAFKNAYVEMGFDKKGNWKVVGPKNVNGLARKLGRRFMRHTKEQVAPELPQKIFVYEPLQMEGRQQKLYDDIRLSRDIEVKTDEGKLIVPNALAKLVRLQQAASDPTSLGTAYTGYGSIKLDWTREFISDHPELSLVVFTRFVATAQRLYSLLVADGVLTSAYYGNAAGFPQMFLDRKTNVLVATIAKGGEGLDLKFVDAAIFVDQEWSTIRMQQAYDRIHRLGITVPKMLYVLHCSTIDTLIQDAIDKKWDDAALLYEALERNIL
jgi:SNF2 family DNA or RNA helicase